MKLILVQNQSSTSGIRTSSSNNVDDSLGTSDDKGHMYWAKGTGFGTGSTTQSWNVEQALLRQKSEEEHVTVLLQVRINKHAHNNNWNIVCYFRFPPGTLELYKSRRQNPRRFTIGRNHVVS